MSDISISRWTVVRTMQECEVRTSWSRHDPVPDAVTAIIGAFNNRTDPFNTSDRSVKVDADGVEVRGTLERTELNVDGTRYTFTAVIRSEL